MKLHIGCGKVILPDWTNLDILPHRGVDVVDDVRYLSKIADSSCDIIYACHVLEHISRINIDNTLKLWYTKLKPNGILRIAVPNFEKIVSWYLRTGNLEEVLGLLIGGHDDEWDRHGMIFDSNLLKLKLSLAGFRSSSEWDWKETEHCLYDDFSQAYLPHMKKTTGTLMSLNIEAIK